MVCCIVLHEKKINKRFPSSNFIPDLCSHKRSYILWAESVISDSADTFLAVEAKNFNDFKNGALNLALIATMGLNCTMK